MTENVLLLLKGQLVAEGNMYRIRELIDEHPHRILVECDRPRDLARALVDEPCVLSVRFPEDLAVEVETRAPDVCYTQIPARALSLAIKIRRLTSPDASLEAVFRYLVEGKHKRERVEPSAGASPESTRGAEA
jgi:ABC-2 type transport system ATP-binding protein